MPNFYNRENFDVFLQKVTISTETFVYKRIFETNFYLMWVLLAWMSMCHMYAVSAETSSRNWNPGNWSYRWLLHACGCMESNSEKQWAHLTHESYLHPYFFYCTQTECIYLLFRDILSQLTKISSIWYAKII